MVLIAISRSPVDCARRRESRSAGLYGLINFPNREDGTEGRILASSCKYWGESH